MERFRENMNLKHRFIMLSMVFVISALLFSACSNNDQDIGNDNGTDDGKIQIVTTTAQIGNPIQIIGGDRVQVMSLMGPGVDPHLYEPTQRDIHTLNEADIVLYNGLSLEGNMEEIFVQMAKSKLSLGIGEFLSEEQLIIEENGAIDPHIWFDIDLWKEALAGAVEELKAYSPDDTSYFEENMQQYFAELDILKSESLEKLTSIPDEQRILVTAHDAFGYFGRLFDMEVVGLQGLSTEDEIGISDVQSTVDLLIERQVPAVFIESSINESSIQSVIEGAAAKGLDVALGGELFSDAMGEQGTEEGTYLGMYRHNVDTIYQALTRKVDE